MENKKAVYKFFLDCGRMGFLDGVFVAIKSDVDKIIGKTIYFGEVLGKHSDIVYGITKDDIELVTDDPKVVMLFEEHDLSSGYNPLDYYEEMDDEDENEEEDEDEENI